MALEGICAKTGAANAASIQAAQLRIFTSASRTAVEVHRISPFDWTGRSRGDLRMFHGWSERDTGVLEALD
jgi:hypothetical protein